MAQGHLGAVLRQLKKMVGSPSDDASDRALLERFAAARDEPAFATLVERHGPMVLGVCRRVLGDVHAAEDAFQATFLVLARKAGAIRRQGTLAGWLFTVARHAALRARGAAARRRQRERQVPPMAAASPSSELAWRDLRPVLDEEIGRLPDKFRTPFVLCHLEGKTNEEAAQLLGCPRGTILSRLARARERLRVRLERRGVVLTAAALAAVLGENVAPAAVPPSLALVTVQAAALVAGATSLAPVGGVSGPAVTLMNQVLRDLFWSKLRFAVLIVALGLAGMGTGALVHRLGQADGATPALAVPRPEDATDPQEAPSAPGPVIPLAEVGRNLPVRMPRGTGPWVFATAFAPDGKTLVSAGHDQPIRLWDPVTGEQLRELPQRLHVNLLAFAPDGRTMAAAWNDNQNHVSDEISLWDTTAWAPLPSLRPGHRVHTLWFLDRQTLATINNDLPSALSVWDLATGKAVRRTELPRCAWWRSALTADGKIVAAANDRCDNRTPECLIQMFDVATGKEVRTIAVGPKKRGPDGPVDTVDALALSPDGSVLAAVENFDGPPGPAASPVDVGPAPRQRDGSDAPLQVRRIRLWDTASGRELRRWHVSGGGLCYCLAFAPDGRTLVSRHYRTVVLWETASGGERQRFTERDWQLRKCAVFSRDGRSLAWNEGDGRTSVFDLSGVARHGQRCTVALTTEERDALWADLADPDAGKAFRAVQALSAAPGAALDMFRSRLSQEVAGLRLVRGVEVLENLGTLATRRQLQELATASPTPPAAQEARAALQRLARR